MKLERVLKNKLITFVDETIFDDMKKQVNDRKYHGTHAPTQNLREANPLNAILKS